MSLQVCAHGDCLRLSVAAGFCAEHVQALTLNERADMVSLEREAVEAQRERAKTRLQIISAAGFALAGSAAALGLGAGALGVAFVVGAVTGIFALGKSTL